MAWGLLGIFVRKKQAQHIREACGASLNIKRSARAVCYIFNLHTLAVLALACTSVWFCNRMGWAFNMDFSIVSTGTVFPLTFTLAQAFTRRERATALIASIKASVVALYWMHRDWDQTCGYPGSLGNDQLPGAVAARTLLMELLLSIRAYLAARSCYESPGEARLAAAQHEFLGMFEHNLQLSQRSRVFRSAFQKLVASDPGQQRLKECYRWLSKLSVLNERLTLASGYTRGGEGGLSRTNQYLRYIASNLEELRSIKEYRTPTMMRHACGVLLHIFAVVLAPYFVHFCTNLDSCAAGYVGACTYVTIVMLLYHVQQDLENCMDETALDDAFFHVHEEFDEVNGAAAAAACAPSIVCPPANSTHTSATAPAPASQPPCPEGARGLDEANGNLYRASSSPFGLGQAAGTRWSTSSGFARSVR